MDKHNYTMDDFEIGEEVVYTDNGIGIYYHCKVHQFKDGRLHFKVHKKFNLDNDELIRDYDNPINGSVGEESLWKLTFLHGKPDKRQSQLGEFHSKELRSMFIDLAIDTKDDQWLQLLKDDSWKKELLEA